MNIAMGKATNIIKNDLQIRKGIKTLEESISQLQKAKAALISMLPKKTILPKNIIINLSNGKSIDATGRKVDNGSKE